MFPILFLALWLAGLQARPTPRPNTGVARGSIEGVVVRVGAAAARPQISGAVVELKPANISVLSDANGAFSFRNVAAGSYTLSVTREGYIPQEDRRRGLTFSGLAITLPEGVALKNVELPMVPAPAISG